MDLYGLSKSHLLSSQHLQKQPVLTKDLNSFSSAHSTCERIAAPSSSGSGLLVLGALALPTEIKGPRDELSLFLFQGVVLGGGWDFKGQKWDTLELRREGAWGQVGLRGSIEKLVLDYRKDDFLYFGRAEYFFSLPLTQLVWPDCSVDQAVFLYVGYRSGDLNKMQEVMV